MKWGEPPRLIFHPGPAPRLDPHPVPVAIGHPVHRHSGGIPHRAILQIHLPVAGLVEVGGARDVAAHVLCGCRRAEIAVALGTPRVEAISTARCHVRNLGRVRAAQANGLAALHGLAHVSGAHVQAAAVDAHQGGAIARNRDAVLAGLEQAQRSAGGVHLDRVA